MAKTCGFSAMIDVQMGGRCCLVLMAVEAIHHALVGVGNDHGYRSAGRGLGVDITGGVVTLDTAASLMNGEYLREVANNMAIGTGLVIGLTSIGGRVELDGMIDQTAQGAMIMAIEIGGVAGDTLAATSNSRGNQTTVRRVVAGGAALWRMDLTASGEWRGGGAGMAAGTVNRGWAGEHVFLDLGAVVMGVAGKVVSMASSAGAASAAVDRGVAMAIDPGDPEAVCRGVTVGAVVFVYRADGITRVAADAERGGEDRCGVAVGVVGEIERVATGASAFFDCSDVILVGRVS